jgi:DNA invertase Pin-like site-specific DNA recombinase
MSTVVASRREVADAAVPTEAHREVITIYGGREAVSFQQIRHNRTATLRSTLSTVGDIADASWLQGQLAARVPITKIADLAGVSRTTVYAWIERHGLHHTPHTVARPTAGELAALYAQHTTTLELGRHLGVSRDTARRWLHDAQIAPSRGRVDIDVDALRQQRAAGATIAQLAALHGAGNDTIRRRLADAPPPR